MIYREPALEDIDRHVLLAIAALRKRLGFLTQHNPRRWTGSLRKATLARAIQGSNSIEGYVASLDEAMAAVNEEPPLDERTETWLAINGYREALTYILQTVEDPTFEFGRQFLKSLHFMMIQHDMAKRPGQWRSGPIYVVDDRYPDPLYEAPDSEQVDELVEELVRAVRADGPFPVIVKAAMAHLNLAMIHPFRDGNGRMARALQTLVLAQDGLVHPIFSSIEEWLGANTPAYYEILRKMSDGTWSPGHDTLPWIRFCLTAHYQQAFTLVRRHEEYAALFELIEGDVTRRGLHQRTAIPLFDAALGARITNAKYQKDAEVSAQVATRDLRALVDHGLLAPRGEKRGASLLRQRGPGGDASANQDPQACARSLFGPARPALGRCGTSASRPLIPEPLPVQFQLGLIHRRAIPAARTGRRQRLGILHCTLSPLPCPATSASLVTTWQNCPSSTARVSAAASSALQRRPVRSLTSAATTPSAGTKVMKPSACAMRTVDSTVPESIAPQTTISWVPVVSSTCIRSVPMKALAVRCSSTVSVSRGFVSASHSWPGAPGASGAAGSIESVRR